MQIRSITIGKNFDAALDEAQFPSLASFQSEARARFERAGLPVQTVRLATQPFPEILSAQGPQAAPAFARALETLCQRHGIDYCSIGTVPADQPQASLHYIDVIPEVLEQTEMAFASALVASRGSGINLAAIARCAQVIADVAHATPDGFGNLRFAVLANCDPGSPFFPAAFHRGEQTSFSIATEAVNLAVDAFTAATTLTQARTNLRTAVEAAAETMEAVGRDLAAEFGLRFGGIDFSMAPYPEAARSIGHALEALGVDAFGANSTLFAVAFTTQILHQARFARCGFSGLLLPVLEDVTLAQRGAESLYTLDSLLLYSAVCGTGLDTVPLPGDVSVDELAAILLDMATLAVVADKPLTARLMPIPGKSAGEMTDYDFSYFANGRILEAKGRGGRRIFEGGTFVEW
ncbi:MAG: DUF711 family protein [Anaerolineae bacterium]|jgi:uncharacterized protein (UPF0210 family)